ncbi:MAG: CCA tRNA nucleotidyltransferase [Solobacterium sp.]|nr:CCA tRNA nucleotidyltransferase [Solobacterium sp.]
MKRTMPLPSFVKNAIKMLNEAGYEAYVVGGAVRSWYLEQEISDYDVTSSATPDEIQEVFSQFRTLETGKKHGTITVLFKRNPIEITTYRTESGYRDHRHPDHVAFTRSLEEDTARRDFTINALCYHPKTGILDFYGGVQDLQNKLIRTVGNPNERFEEDALRILRAVRFSSMFGFTIEEQTKKALLELTPTLAVISQERITSELNRTITGPYFTQVLQEYRPVFEQVIPELREYPETLWIGIGRNIAHTDPDLHIRMALLLDCLNDSERSEEILRRLKYSNEDRQMVINLLKNRDMPMDTRIDLRKVINRLTVPFPVFLDFRCARDTRLNKKKIMDIYEAIVHDHDCCTLKQLDVNGKDLQKLGLKGSAISVAMHTLLNAVMEEKVVNSHDELIRYLENLKTAG